MGTGTWGLGVGLEDKNLGFGGGQGWDMGTWGLGGVGRGQPFKPFRFWGLGHEDLGFRGGTWGQPFRFWGLGQAAPGGYMYLLHAYAHVQFL